MRVAITGASGSLGRHVVGEMLGAGHEVYAIDRIKPTAPVRYCVLDICDLGQLCSALHGCDAVLHLAAIPSPMEHPPEVVFATNALGTFNVFEAAVLVGISRLVSISSSSALGVAYRTHPVPLQYVPVDEGHPLLPQDAYGLSKQVGETICDAFNRRTGGDAVSLRFPLIWDSEASPNLLDELSRNELEAGHTLWSYIDIRDAARACRLAIEKEGLGAQAFYVTAPETFMDVPSAELARRHYPRLQDIRGNDTGRWSFHNCIRAKELLSFEALHHYRPAVGT